MFVAATGAYKTDQDFFTFPIYLLTKDTTKNLGFPFLSPSKMVAQENDPTMAHYDTESVSPIEMWMFAKPKKNSIFLFLALLQPF